MIKTFYGATLEECIDKANAEGRSIIQFHYEVVMTYPIQQYRLVVSFGGLK